MPLLKEIINKIEKSLKKGDKKSASLYIGQLKVKRDRLLKAHGKDKVSFLEKKIAFFESKINSQPKEDKKIPKASEKEDKKEKAVKAEENTESIHPDMEKEAKLKGHLDKVKEKSPHNMSFFERWKKKKHGLAMQKREGENEKPHQQRKFTVNTYLERASISKTQKEVEKWIFSAAIVLNFIITAIAIFKLVALGVSVLWYAIMLLAVIWTFGFILLIFSLWALFYLYIDIRIYRRTKEVEEVLPDFLQLTSSNIRAGRPIDQALWYAIRPKFGVLAREIETVAKQTMSGTDLKAALIEFSAKYDSVLLKRSMALLIEGIDAGGEIGELLNRIANDIKESKILKSEMAANVTTYNIFITVASVVAAPFLFALAHQLIMIVAKISSNLELSQTSSTGLAISFSGSGILPEDFKIFAIVSLVITSFFSAMIIATIKKGSIKADIKYIPLFWTASITIFLVADWGLSKALGVFF